MRFPGPGDPVAGLHNTSCVFVCALVCVLMFYTDSAHKCTLGPDSAWRAIPTLGSEGGPGTMRFPGPGDPLGGWLGVPC